VDPTAGLDDVKRKFLTLPALELRPPGHPARSQSLSRLRLLHYTAQKLRDYPYTRPLTGGTVGGFLADASVLKHMDR
jgi:hypothetical protein